MLSAWLGNSATSLDVGSKSYQAGIVTTGFYENSTCHLGHCADRRFDDVEQADRFVGAVAVQCVKPL